MRTLLDIRMKNNYYIQNFDHYFVEYHRFYFYERSAAGKV